MNDISTSALIIALVILLLLSAFFSSSETGMMALNRYRLKHLVKKKNKGAIRATELLKRPDRLIGVILLGNNLVNNLAAALATILALKFISADAGPAIAAVAITILMLIFAELTPKTIAALHPERIAFPASFILKPLLWLFYPAVWLINHVSNFLVRLGGIDPEKHHLHEHLNPDELRTVVDEAGDLIPDQHQSMLLNILDLEKSTVEDIMIPRNEIVGLDLEDDVQSLLNKIHESEYTRLPVYEGDINNVVGILHLRNMSKILQIDVKDVTHALIRRHVREPYFIPISTPLHTQLLNFQKQKRRIAITVDEYGDVQGLVTLEDLLEEIVGDFTTNLAEEQNQEIEPIGNGWHLIDGGTSIRDINRSLRWQLPVDEAKTLNGLMMEYLENIPDGNSCFEIEHYRFETVIITDKMIDRVKVMQLERAENSDEDE